MDGRQERGMRIAATRTIGRNGSNWLVPSESGKGTYKVTLSEPATCECDDFRSNGGRCKHIFAAAFAQERDSGSGKDAVTKEAVSDKVTPRKTYPQDWSAYNAAKTHQKGCFLYLLDQLCLGCCNQEKSEKVRGGRPPIPLPQAVFTAVLKVYSGWPSRQFISELLESGHPRYLTTVRHFNSISNYLAKPLLTPILVQMIELSALPLASVETDFAIDSSGFATRHYYKWFGEKYGTRPKQDWLKLHIMSGVKTNVITAVAIGSRDAHDAPYLPGLLYTTARNFKISDVCGDAAYASLKNAEAIVAAGGKPFLLPKSNTTGAKGGAFQMMYHFYEFNHAEFLEHYHKRSNIEATMAMLKKQFGESLFSKGEVALINELLCKVLCHNIVVLAHELYELKINL